MADIDAPVAVVQVWRQQGVWSRAAATAKGRITRARLAVAALTVTGAVAGTGAARFAETSSPAARTLAILAAAALLLVPVAGRGASRQAVRTWTGLRAVSEALKAEVYRRLSGTAPYAGDERDAVLLRRYDRLLDDAGALLAATLDVAPVDRPLPPVTDPPSYLVERVRRQVDDYYLPAARRAAAAAARLRSAATALTVLSAVLSAIVGVLGDGLGLTAWVGVAATVSTALLGYGAAQRHELHQIEYARTADQLSRLLLTREAGQGWTDDDGFVAEAERIISVANQGWLAAMVEEDGAPQQ